MMEMTKKLLNALVGESLAVPPLWLMRQAGRYLPEYRAVRAQAGSFLDLCFNPELAAEVTLQPIRRFDFDAAIIFADILLIPAALGCNLRFVEGEGPRLDPVTRSAQLDGAELGTQLDPVYAALRLVRQELAVDKALIGFCGAPFTVACYMVSGGGSKDFSAVDAYISRDRADFLRLLDSIVAHSIIYLCAQVAAGAEVLQIFESWAGLVRPEDWQDCVVRPTAKIVAAVKAVYPHIPIIGFPRGAGGRYHGFAKATGVTAVGLDQSVTLEMAAAVQTECPVQGNLDPAMLVQGRAAQADAVRAIKTKLGGGAFIFNLGHGITPDTPLEHVKDLVRQVRAL